MLAYIEYSFTISPLQPASDILIAELGEVGFESFVEHDEGLKAYIPKKDWNDGLLENIFILNHGEFEILHSYKEIPIENWNSNWERNFNPIQIGDQCTVRAPFHEKRDVRYDIVIEPKMSFGTGHHETTHMMLQMILDYDLQGKSVLDMGCGTGVLAILTAMRGADRIDAIDIDNWSYLNASENVKRNEMGHINVYEGDVTLLQQANSNSGTNSPKSLHLSNESMRGHRTASSSLSAESPLPAEDASQNQSSSPRGNYDVILANINRNILLQDIPFYAQNLTKNGMLFVSGFYADDLLQISEKCKENGLRFKKNIEKNQWVAAKYLF